jgi:hypothetical protein
VLTMSRAGFDWRGFGTALRQALAARGQPPLRRLADDIGVTTTDLSRASNGVNVSIEKVFAICDWMGEEARDFYVRPTPETCPAISTKSTCCTSAHVKQGGVG